jgi:hypothetical protein
VGAAVTGVGVGAAAGAQATSKARMSREKVRFLIMRNSAEKGWKMKVEG